MAKRNQLKNDKSVKICEKKPNKDKAFVRKATIKAMNLLNGRPPLEPQNYQQVICEFIRKGNYVETAAAASGVTKETLYTWLKEGAKAPPDSPYRIFSDAVCKAVAESETRLIDRVEDHSKKGDLRADTWRLERRFPNRWGLKGRIELTGEGGGPVRVTQEFDFSRLTTDELETLERLLDKARPPKLIEPEGSNDV